MPGALRRGLREPRLRAAAGGGGDDAPERTLATARALADRLRRWGSVGLSTFHSDPAGFRGAIHEAELVLEVLTVSGGAGMGSAQDIGTGTYRLLFRVLASHPEEVRSFYEDTVAPIVRYDDQYRTDLVGTLDAYLEHNCNMNATAAAIYAHRHTVAYRLDRVRELTSLDPTLSRGPRAPRPRAQGLPDHRSAAAEVAGRARRQPPELSPSRVTLPVSGSTVD